ncbi:MAG: hypothetical protein QM656_12745 [Paracoccaceae bacterium]
MMRSLYLHLGAPCTGAAAFQAFLKRNRKPLAERGILSPDGDDAHACGLDALLRGEVTATALADSIEMQIADTRGNAEVRAVVLSDGQSIMRRDQAPLAALAERFVVRPIYVLRRQDLWLESWFRQNAIRRWNSDLAQASFPEFLSHRSDFHWINYDRTVRRLDALFDARNVILPVFETAHMPDGPLAALAQAIGLEDLDGLDMTDRGDAGLSPLMTEFMRSLPLDRLTAAARLRVERACRVADAELMQSLSQSNFYMDHSTRRAVMADYQDGNAGLARRRFGRAELFAEPLPAADAPLAMQNLPAGSYDLVRLVVAPVLAELARADDPV